MLDAVGTLSANPVSLRSVSQGAVAASYAAPAVESSSRYYVSSRIRVDNLLDMAILEFRAAETGDVIRQYPTESQIRAFQRASELDTRKAEAVARQARQQLLQQETPAASSAGEGVSQGESFTPSAPQPAPAPVAAAPAAASTPSGAGSVPAASGSTGETAQHAVSTFA